MERYRRRQARLLGAARELHGSARLDLIAVRPVAGAVAGECRGSRVGQPHAQRPELELPDVAQLVDDEVFVEHRVLQEDQVRVAYPRKRRKPGTWNSHGATTMRTPRTSTGSGYSSSRSSRAFARLSSSRLFTARAACGLKSQKTKMMSRIRMRIAAPMLRYRCSPRLD